VRLIDCYKKTSLSIKGAHMILLLVLLSFVVSAVGLKTTTFGHELNELPLLFTNYLGLEIILRTLKNSRTINKAHTLLQTFRILSAKNKKNRKIQKSSKE
jgi:uncharacterized membrane protein YbhN (UPF0104 family)